ncbi:hypothetical protein I6F30_29780 [Bradyrhizobium sp. NBAIM20]|uniref:hypothetical protein n=1 Tax=unclassified Bradyrhizobium TaxID=2631580 RepID=UPI001CD648CB|nr:MULTISPECIES: hypothetical protein [unclassified Bradyrhizobium]MCA1415289.1 hypothetical protein [Bradyrhizobium sp. NBAIM20]MCA1461117.1 hypothetical protein [Bradyrhizobium sp. NBAIM18]
MIDWPTREEFLSRRQGPYVDRMDGLDYSRRLASYASWAEITTLYGALRERYRLLGRELKQIKAALGPLAQQPGETLIPWHCRVLAMSASEQDRVQELWTCQHRRQDINQLLRDMDDGIVPTRGRKSSVVDIGEKLPLLDTIQERYRAAYQAALEKRWAEIDEADWQRELKRRARIETAA